MTHSHRTSMGGPPAKSLSRSRSDPRADAIRFPAFLGIPIDFLLFAGVLIGVAVLHRHCWSPSSACS